jgi:hypothetical protein
MLCRLSPWKHDFEMEKSKHKKLKLLKKEDRIGASGSTANLLIK